eukprot:442410_1
MELTIKEENEQLQKELDALKQKYETVAKENKQLKEEKNDEKESLEQGKEVNITNMTKQTLTQKFKTLKDQNLELQHQIFRLLSPCDQSYFPSVTDICDDFVTLRKQWFTDLFDVITDEIADQYEDIQEEWEDELDDDDDDYKDSGVDVFDTVIDRETRRILFNLLHITYHFIRIFKHAKFNHIV